MVCKSVWQSGKKTVTNSLASGVSRWFTNCQTNCLRARIFFPCFCAGYGSAAEKFIILESARSRGGHGAGARAPGGGRHERYMAARLLLLRCARVCAIKRACGPFKSRHGLSIKKKKRKPDNGCQDVHALYFHNSVS